MGIGEWNERNAVNKGWEKYDECDGNAGAKNQRGNAGNLGENTKNLWNQGGEAGTHGGNLSIVVEITWNSNGNDKLKDWREVKIINLVSCI